jgi:hypothetical protein
MVKYMARLLDEIRDTEQKNSG